MQSYYFHPYQWVFNGAPSAFESRSFKKLSSDIKHLYLYNDAVTPTHLNDLSKFQDLESLMISFSPSAPPTNLGFLAALPRLKTLRLTNLKLPEDGNWQQITTLPLEHLELGVPSCENLLKKIMPLKEMLRSLEVYNDKISEDEACEFLAHHPHLECLGLPNLDKLSRKFIEQINSLSIQNLNLRSAPLLPWSEEEELVFQDLANRNLKSLSFAYLKKITPRFCEFISSMKCLTHLELGAETSGKNWSDPLLKMKQLKEFHLSSSKLARSILIPKALKDELHDCQLFDEKGMYLPEARSK